jgi:hypothetical protein
MRRLLCLSFALLPTLAVADEVYTRGGGHLSGEVVEQTADSIVVDIGAGRIGLPASYVERIERAPSPRALYRQRADLLAPDDTAGWVALGRWAREQDLETLARESFEHVLSQDPAHPAAHAALGHVKVGDQWMTREESYEARGLVPFEGSWVTPGQQQAILTQRTAEQAAARAAFEEQLLIRQGEADLRESEARARVAEAQARIAESDARQVESAELGIFHSFPSAFVGQRVFVGPSAFVGQPLTGAGFHRGGLPGCSRRNSFAHSVPLAVSLAGTGGAFVVMNESPARVVRR